MPALYQISEEIRRATMPIENEYGGIDHEPGSDDDGELPAGFAAMLDRLELAFDDKAESIALLCQEWLREADAAKAESDRLRRLAVVREHRVKTLKQYLQNCMEATGRFKIETPLVKLRVQRNSRPSIDWTRSIADLPEPFRRVVVSLDGQTAFETWKREGALPAGFEVETGSHLRIS